LWNRLFILVNNILIVPERNHRNVFLSSLNTERIQKEYRKNTERIQKEYRKNTERIQKEYRKNTERPFTVIKRQHYLTLTLFNRHILTQMIIPKVV